MGDVGAVAAGDYGSVLLLALLPCAGILLGGVLAGVYRGSRRTSGLVLHGAAGALLAVVGFGLVPHVLETGRPWLPLLALVPGAAGSLLLERGTRRAGSRLPDDQARRDRETGAVAGPRVAHVGVALGPVAGGVMIATGSHADPALGVLLALGLVPAGISVGFATAATLRARAIPGARRFLIGASFAIPLLLGAMLGLVATRDAPTVARLSVLTFTGGLPVFAAVHRMEAEVRRHRRPERGFVALAFGFGLYAFLAGLLAG